MYAACVYNVGLKQSPYATVLLGTPINSVITINLGIVIIA